MNKYSITLLIICLADLAFTALGINMQVLQEANPILLWALKWGLSGLIIVKLFFTIIPIIFLEYVWRSGKIEKKRMRLYYRFGIWVYFLVLSGTIACNY